MQTTCCSAFKVLNPLDRHYLGHEARMLPRVIGPCLRCSATATNVSMQIDQTTLPKFKTARWVVKQETTVILDVTLTSHARLPERLILQNHTTLLFG